MNVGIIGGGWYGCHVALALKKRGHKVMILEKNADIFSGVSGDFGIRLHKGPHYPRSSKTRESCRRAFDEFIETYPELVVTHDYSTYALGTIDSLNNPPKVSKEEFKEVCQEDTHCEELDSVVNGYTNLINVFNQEEPSIVVGSRLRELFRGYLSAAGIEVKYGYTVTELNNQGDSVIIGSDNPHAEKFTFDKVVNATGCAAYLPTDIATEGPVSMEVVYQPCLGLLYADTKPKAKPFSFIVMDGWFPCIMPYLDDQAREDKLANMGNDNNENHHKNENESSSTDTDNNNITSASTTTEQHRSQSQKQQKVRPQQKDSLPEEAYRKYVLTHGNYTIMASCATHQEASEILDQLTNEFIAQYIQPPSEREINRFWPEFKDRFKYLGWKGRVLAKLRTKTEFRSAVTFACPSPVIHIIPGKVGNIFDAEREVLALIENRDDTIAHKNHYSYVIGGVLDVASHEINAKPFANEPNTCSLNTFLEMSESNKARIASVPAKGRWRDKFANDTNTYTHTVHTGLFCISADNYVLQSVPKEILPSPTLNRDVPSIFSGMFCISSV